MDCLADITHLLRSYIKLCKWWKAKRVCDGNDDGLFDGTNKFDLHWLKQCLNAFPLLNISTYFSTDNYSDLMKIDSDVGPFYCCM